MKNTKLSRLIKTATLVAIFSVGFSGCYKNNLEDCLLEASKAPTAQGVGVAISACEKKYKKPISEAERIVRDSEKCDIAKLDEYATWIVTNKSQKGSAEFEKVATAYKNLRATCEAIKAVN
jgi:hypothetical protein